MGDYSERLNANSHLGGVSHTSEEESRYKQDISALLEGCADLLESYGGHELAAGFTILEENLVGAQILDLKGCSPEAVLYYVNQDIPVLAALNDGNAVLIVGFNEYSYGVMNPQTGDIKRVGQRDFTEWMQENGNSFMTYIR